ncbi:MAG: MFS transporter [Solirubrobacterales bacterium]|nr:MFS transporter [Solirubrobacterales bacterium]
MSSPGFLLPRNTISHGRAFWAMAAIAVTFPAISAVPSPLYSLYQDLWGFSDSVLTEVFAVYVVALLVSLLVFGALSDHVGRRPVLLGAILLEAVSLVLFLVAGGVAALAVARVVQGLATGVALATLGAVIVDLQPEHAPKRSGVVNGVAPLAGLAIGALGCGLLIQLAPWPTSLVFVILLAALALASVAVWLSPETSTMHPGARESLKPQVGLPPHLRSEFISLVPIMIAGWALAGLYLSLGPSIAGIFLDDDSYLTGGLVVTALCGTGAFTVYFLREREPRSVIRLAAGWLAAGTAVSLTGLELEVAPLALAGTFISGIGFGASALGSFGSLVNMAEPDTRGELYALAYVVGYVAFSLPAVAGGFAADRLGLHTTALIYGAVILVVTLIAFHAARPRRSVGSSFQRPT